MPIFVYRYEIMDQCWRVNPKERPTFGNLRAKFDALISAQKDNMPYIDLEVDAENPYYDRCSLASSENDNSSIANSISAEKEQPALVKEMGSIGSSLAMGLEDTSNIPEPIPNPYVDTPSFATTCNVGTNARSECERND